MSERTIGLTGGSLTTEDVVAVARQRARVTLTDEARRRMRKARDVVDAVIERGETVYGLNTGLGSFSRYRIEEEDLAKFSLATVADLTPYGKPFPSDVVRAMMVTRANSMAKAGAGVRIELAQLLIDLLNNDVNPVVHEFGSVGQGDLSEMSDIGKVLIGLGSAEVGGTVLTGAAALERVGLRPMELAAKEALALISANGVTLGRGALVLHDIADAVDQLQVAAALSLEGFAGNLSIIHPGVIALQPRVGVRAAGERLSQLLQGSFLWEPESARNLQDPLSFRCVPRSHGALYDALGHARANLEIELNGANDNPLVLIDDGVIVSVGNFDVVGLAMAFDYLRLGIALSIKNANERVQKLLWAHFSGLPSELTYEHGTSNGLKPLGRWCAALAAEARSLAHPVTLDYAGQVAEGIEDDASMAPLSVRRTHEMVSLAHKMIAYELITAAQAVDMRGSGPLGRGTEIAYGIVRRHVPVLRDVRGWGSDIEGLVDCISKGELGDAIAGEPRALPERSAS